MRQRGFEVCKGYEGKNINLPKRQTAHSVGYDLEAAEDIVIPSIWRQVFKVFAPWLKGEHEDVVEIKPTLVKYGVKAYFGEDEVMYIYNRSGNPIKKGLIVANGVGVIESDYYGNETNDGELMTPFYNFFPFDVKIKKGERVAQGVFAKFLKVDDDNAEGERTGGFGSTENTGKI